MPQCARVARLRQDENERISELFAGSGAHAAEVIIGAGKSPAPTAEVAPTETISRLPARGREGELTEISCLDSFLKLGLHLRRRLVHGDRAVAIRIQALVLFIGRGAFGE
jgi:hypothetical protein